MNGILRYSPLRNIFKTRCNIVFRSSYCANEFQPFYNHFLKHLDNIAVYDDFGSYKYRDILHSSYSIAKKIDKILPVDESKNERISFLCTSNATYVSVLLACWLTGNTAVPLCTSHPEAMLEYYVANSKSKLVIACETYAESLQKIASKVNASFFTADRVQSSLSKDQYREIKESKYLSWNSDFSVRNALIIYTSGSTGLPKGVVLTHGILHAQISAVVPAWEISATDSILHALPLHHIHGLMNGLLCPLTVGGALVMRPKFESSEVWKYFLNDSDELPRVNLFFAVPTMYVKLIREFELSFGNKSFTRKQMQNMRLMSSGSASLPEPVFNQWESITGHRLLERFGMTEIGMALSNPLNGKRVPGSVGKPLPGVEVKIQEIGDSSTDEPHTFVQADCNGVKVSPKCEGKAGELLIKGPNVFKEYWNNEKATVETFTTNGWFKTGDTAACESGYFKILGRTSVDIIKSGGYKISALQVESCLLSHPNILECTVLGLPDDEWGERVSALILTKDGKEIPVSDLKTFCKKQLPPYAVPTIIKFVSSIPRNVMGKVNKKELRLKVSL